jgi:hypothetical protein
VQRQLGSGKVTLELVGEIACIQRHARCECEDRAAFLPPLSGLDPLKRLAVLERG